MADIVKKEKENESMALALEQDNIDLMKQKAQLMIDAKLAPAALNTSEKVITVALMGKELGVPFNIAVHNIYIINGKPALSVHLIAALLKNANIFYKCIEDYVTIDIVTGNLANPDTPQQNLTKRTTFVFKTLWNNIVEEQTFSLTLREAELAGWTEKDTWRRMPRIMCRNRCLAIGARLVAPDVLMGMYEVSEAAEIFQEVAIEFDEEGNPIDSR